MLKDEVIKILESVGIKTNKEVLEVPPNEEFGDIAFPCFGLAKQEQKNPQEIAEELVKKIRISKNPLIIKTEARGGYVNFFFYWEKVAEKVLSRILSKEKISFGKNKPIMVEFAHPNTHKSFHIGHFRNISLGESLCRILEFTGYKVIRTNYQGDIGPHVAKCLWGYKNLFESKPPKQDRGEWLGKVYTEANKKVTNNEQLEKEIDEINKKIYAKDPSLNKLWKTTRRWSLDYFSKIYKELGVEFNKLYFESEVEKRGVEISQEALKKNIAKLSNEAIVVDLEKYGLGATVIVTKLGTPLYMAKDLGLAEKEFTDFKVDRCIHVVGSEQDLYFKQLFKIFEFINSPAAKKSQHLSYGLVMLKEGKMSSREGNVVLYSELRDKIVEKTLGEVAKRNPKLSKRTKVSLAKKIALGAMKYAMIKIAPENTIIFDWEGALKLEGNTGPYLQYAHTRCLGILKKSKKHQTILFSKLSPHEKHLIKVLMNFYGVAVNAAKDNRPNFICNYAYELATTFNNFYQNCPVLKANDPRQRDFRLTLVTATKIVLENSLKLLGIKVPERM